MPGGCAVRVVERLPVLLEALLAVTFLGRPAFPACGLESLY